jgi:hypothetical protein
MPKGKFTPFTAEQKQKIKDEFLQKPVKRLASELGCSGGRIMRFLKRNNLHIPPALIKQRKQASRFNKGNVPFNAGLKMSDYMDASSIANVKQTQFKKGSEPHNTKFDGAVVARTDSGSGRIYKYIRIEKGVWKLLHRHIWQQAHGDIPDGYLIAFKDGDTENTAIENLELVSMTENMYRNSKHDYPDEIIPSLTLNKLLENKINDLENG